MSIYKEEWMKNTLSRSNNRIIEVWQKFVKKFKVYYEPTGGYWNYTEMHLTENPEFYGSKELRNECMH
jgi:hypothetical protein